MSRNFELLRRAQHGSDPLDSITLPGESGQPAPPRYYQPPVRAAAGTIGGESEWLHAVNILRKHWQSAAAFALTVVLIVTLVTFMIRPVYAPIARIEVDPPGSEVFSMQGGTEGGNTGEYIATQARNLQSEELGMHVVRTLHLDSNPDFAGDLAGNGDPIAPGAGSAAGTVAENAALKALENRLSVSRESASRLVFVSVAAHDPVQAAGITNKLVSLFIEREYEMRHQAVLQSSQWLQKQLEDIRARMEQSTSTLADFQRSSGIAAVGDNQNTFAEQMNELSRQLMQAQADRIQMQSFLNRFDGQASSSLPQISGNPVVQALTQKRAEVQAELAQSLAIYGKNHPVVRKLQNQADELQAQLVAQRAAILRDLKTSYSAAQARENLMQSEMKGAGRQLALLAQYNDLKKEADANTTLYNNLYAKIKEAGINAESKSSPIRLVDAARVLDTPTRPRRLTNIAIGILAGLFGGLVLAFVREGMDTTIHTADDMKKCIGAGSVSVVPVIGAPASAVSRLLPPKVGKNGLARVFLRDRPNSPEAEALRGLYTSVRLSQRERPPQLLLVASPFPGEGKTTVSINLAIALAQHGRTCLVDADLRKEGVAPAFKISAPYGLADVLLEKKTLDEALVPAPGVPNLVVLGTGASTLHPARLVTSDAMEELLRRLRVKFDFVLIDSPPVLPFADGRALSSQVDGVVLVGRAGMTKREAVTRAVEILQEVHSAPIQVVLNAAEYPAVEYRYYRYGAR